MDRLPLSGGRLWRRKFTGEAHAAEADALRGKRNAWHTGGMKGLGSDGLKAPPTKPAGPRSYTAPKRTPGSSLCARPNLHCLSP